MVESSSSGGPLGLKPIVWVLIAIGVVLTLTLVLLLVLIQGEMPCQGAEATSPDVSAVVAPIMCLVPGQEMAFVLEGAEFYKHSPKRDEEFDHPVVSFAGEEIDGAEAVECEKVDVYNRMAETCTQIEGKIPYSASNMDAAVFEVQNPDPCVDSSAESDLKLAFVTGGVPRVVGLASSQATSVCPQREGSVNLTVDVEHFYVFQASPGVWTKPAVEVDGTVIPPAAIHLTTCADVHSLAKRCTTVTVELPASGFGNLVSDPEFKFTHTLAKCTTTATAALTGLQLNNPQDCKCVVAFFVDPPASYSPISLTVKVFVSDNNQSWPLRAVPASGTGTGYDLNGERCDGSDCTKLIGTLPVGMTPGSYDIVVMTPQCPPRVAGGLTVVGTPTINIDRVFPAHGWTSASTDVTLEGSNFVSTPRVYLSRTSGSAPALAMRGVDFQSARTLTGVVPPAPAADYRIVVINPTTPPEVGVLAPSGYFRVQATDVPVIDRASPELFEPTGVATVNLTGSNFDDVTGVNISLACRNAATNAPVGTLNIPAASVTVGSPSSLSFSVSPAQWPGAESTCLVTMTNLNTEAQATYASIARHGVTPPDTFDANATLLAPRRLPAGVTLEVTRSSKFAALIGGDDGTFAGANDTTQSCSIGLTGNLGAMSYQRNRLPAPRTFGGAVTLGQYVYYVAGADATGAGTNTVWRAQLLRPDQTPTPDVTFALLFNTDGSPKATSFNGGLWFYRISATFDNTNPDNKDGESLPGELLTIQLPQGIDNIEMTITWTPVPGASGYKVYRTATRDQSANDVVLYATIATATTTFTDSNTGTPGTATPLPVGSFGPWYSVGTLATARMANAVAVAPDPAAPNKHYLYAIGGAPTSASLSAAFITDYEVFEITVQGPSSAADCEHQTLSATPTTFTLGRIAGYQQALVLTEKVVPDMGSQAIVLLMGGTEAGGTGGRIYQYGYVAAGTGRISATTDGASNPFFTGNNSPRRYPCSSAQSTTTQIQVYQFGGGQGSNVPVVFGDSTTTPAGQRPVFEIAKIGADLDATFFGGNPASALALAGNQGGFFGCVEANGVVFMFGGYDDADTNRLLTFVGGWNK
jgi:IPT/TIG domain